MGKKITNKEEILEYAQTHTLKETSEAFDTAISTISKWRKQVFSGDELPVEKNAKQLAEANEKIIELEIELNRRKLAAEDLAIVLDRSIVKISTMEQELCKANRWGQQFSETIESFNTLIKG